MGNHTEKNTATTNEESLERHAVVINILFLIGEFAFVAGSSIALAAALEALKKNKSSGSNQ